MTDKKKLEKALRKYLEYSSYNKFFLDRHNDKYFILFLVIDAYEDGEVSQVMHSKIKKLKYSQFEAEAKRLLKDVDDYLREKPINPRTGNLIYIDEFELINKKKSNETKSDCKTE